MSKDKRKIIIKTKQEIENIKESWKYLTELLILLNKKTTVSMPLLDLEKIAINYIASHKASNIKWAFKWYNGFPTNLCLSVNDCVVHGIPDNYILKNWDILKIDCWITYKWWISDSAICVVIGWELANPTWYALTKATKAALDNWLKQIKPYKKIFAYSEEVEKTIKNKWFNIIKNLTGHWVGRMVHEAPYIYNYAHSDMKKVSFKPGMVVALEPITSLHSTDSVEKQWNSRNLYTKKWDIWAQWEYTIVITENWYEIISGITEEIF